MAGKAHAIPRPPSFTWSVVPGAPSPVPRRLMAVVAVGGMLLASCWKRNLPFPAGVHSRLPWQEGRAGPGPCEWASEALAPGLFIDV